MSTFDIDKLQAICLNGVPTRDADGIILPPSYKVESLENVLEKHREHPRRHRGTFSTHLIAAFAKYVVPRIREGSAIFLDPERRIAVCRLNHGTEATPEWGDDRAQLTLRETPEYTALRRLCSETLSQEALVDYIVDWAPYLAFSTSEIAGTPDDGAVQTMPLAAAIGAIRNLKVQTASAAEHKQTDTDRERSLFESAAVTSEPPRTMQVTIATYDGLEARTIRVRLVYRPTNPPVIKAMLVAQGELELRIAQEFERRVVFELNVASDATCETAFECDEIIHIGTYT